MNKSPEGFIFIIVAHVVNVLLRFKVDLKSKRAELAKQRIGSFFFGEVSSLNRSYGYELDWRNRVLRVKVGTEVAHYKRDANRP